MSTHAATRYLYSARLVPIGRPVRIPFVDGSPTELETFTDESFELDRTAKTKPPILLNHDKGLQIGRAVVLTREGGWWCTDFALDPDVPVDVEFEVGQPVSVGLSSLKIGSGSPWLKEISIVRTGAVKGARITRRFAIEPKPHRSPAVAGEIIHGGRVFRREFPAVITLRGSRGEVIRNEADGSQTIWASEADYRADVAAVR